MVYRISTNGAQLCCLTELVRGRRFLSPLESKIALAREGSNHAWWLLHETELGAPVKVACL